MVSLSLSLSLSTPPKADPTWACSLWPNDPKNDFPYTGWSVCSNKFKCMRKGAIFSLYQSVHLLHILSVQMSSKPQKARQCFLSAPRSSKCLTRGIDVFSGSKMYQLSHHVFSLFLSLSAKDFKSPPTARMFSLHE